MEAASGANKERRVMEAASGLLIEASVGFWLWVDVVPSTSEEGKALVVTAMRSLSIHFFDGVTPVTARAKAM